jgi:hypothetical protein
MNSGFEKAGENPIKVPVKSKAQHPLASPLKRGMGGRSLMYNFRPSSFTVTHDV